MITRPECNRLLFDKEIQMGYVDYIRTIDAIDVIEKIYGDLEKEKEKEKEKELSCFECKYYIEDCHLVPFVEPGDFKCNKFSNIFEG